MPLIANQTKDGIYQALRSAATHLNVPSHLTALSSAPRATKGPLRMLGRVLGHSTENDGPSGEPKPGDRLSIPVAENTDEDLDSQEALHRGQFLARQDMWSTLLAELAEADQIRAMTAAGTSVAELIAFGARADIVNTLEHGLREGLKLDDRVMLDGILEMERIRLEQKRAPLISTLVALTHIDVGWAFLGYAKTPGQDTTKAKAARAAASHRRGIAHFERASALIDHAEFSTLSGQRSSPLTAAARCALYSGLPAPAKNVADDYAELIDLDPENPRHMRALGNHMLPRWCGSYEALELEARRTAARVENIWGAGGYTWVYFDAIAQDPAARAHMDIQFFLDGFADIVDRSPGQEMINLLTAYCCLSLQDSPQETPAAAEARKEVADNAHWLVRNNLRELHPMIWAHAAEGFANNLPLGSQRRFAERGRRDALTALSDMFSAEIAAGHRVVFTHNGPELMQDI